MICAYVGIYQSHRLSSTGEEITDLFKVTGPIALALGATGALFRLNWITPLTVIQFFLINTAVIVASRLVSRWWLRLLRAHGRNCHNVLIAGTNTRAIDFAQIIAGRPDIGYRLLGYVDDHWVGSELRPADARIVSNFEGFRSFLRDHVVDEVVLALPIKSLYAQVDKMIRFCREQGVVVRMLGDFFEPSYGKARIDQFETNPIMTFFNSPIDGLPVLAKRALDIAASLIMLLFFSPLLLITAFLVKADSSGPALFVQERVGLNKRRFRMYKFRTMVTNAELLQKELESQNELSGPIFKIRRDPRITRIGRFLRKSSLDELPQLLNVFKGDMSLVGPRPMSVRDYECFEHDWYWQQRRFSVRPGITGLWQVSGRDSIDFPERMTLDIRYVDQWSLWLDLAILMKTIPTIVAGNAA